MLYTGAFLDEEAKGEILAAFPPAHERVVAHHMTIAFGPDQEEVRATPLGEEVELTVVGEAVDEKAQAIVVESPLSKAEIPHITVSVAEGISSSYSNELLAKGYRRLDTPITIKARVGAFVKGRPVYEHTPHALPDTPPALVGEQPPPTEEAGPREITISKNTLVFIAGLSGSGKSTFARKNFPSEAIVSTDGLRAEMTNNPANQIVSPRVFELACRIVTERLKKGEIAVIDAQNLTAGDRAQFTKIAQGADAEVKAIFLDVPPDEAIARDRERVKATGAEYIARRKARYEDARRTILHDPTLGEVVMLSGEESSTARVNLPPEYREMLEADRELAREGARSELMISMVRAGIIAEKENKEGEQYRGESLEIPAGAVLFAEGADDKRLREFLERNFISHQIIDAADVAKRIHADPSDNAVRDVMKFLLKERVRNNVTTVVTYPTGFLHAGAFGEVLAEVGAKVGVPIPRADLTPAHVEKYARVSVIRDAPPDAPLFLVGDVQGCYTAMRELAGRVRKENLLREEDADDEGAVRRKIVFVGDMADRGPYDAESVIYITALVQSGRAMLIKGNHDENLLKALKGELERHRETQQTAEELKRRLSPRSIQKIVDMLEAAPVYAEWEHLAVAHASLPRMPRVGQVFDKKDEGVLIHGPKSGAFTGTRAEVLKMRNATAHDPEVLVAGGHTHEEAPVVDEVSGSVVLDADAELQGKLWGMYYPELELASAEEPSVLRMYESLQSGVLPEGRDLSLFIEWARQIGLLETKQGSGDLGDLMVVNYSGETEVRNLWERYPTLRHFRGLIVDKEGNIVARPFKKTHKAGIEIPLNELNIVPEKVFEKVNGSMGIVYNRKGVWRAATKFSLENEGYTKPAEEMLAGKNLGTLDPAKTYLFEIILPTDQHIVNYKGKRDLVLLNAITTETGEESSWEEVARDGSQAWHADRRGHDGAVQRKDHCRDLYRGADGRESHESRRVDGDVPRQRRRQSDRQGEDKRI
ncbi:MAG: hypothetical protein A3C93_03720 [Candidatus Lloydbacteria bacterium RIFCSPHIGHO2_02_FULL_54_17]|uniref:Calcineurin-like phosphoesterase domain-containing protein n=1 Tax=Candidatus Lloydbacteria bacterium RIFCSPHIGHO2_02_FULL_54_17 TaxID=1798664 RepID=A0A1G2DH04_9BACT|nr:MAG: hypothetical protein A3C93_03720 [Candidatus Lloydbacteria bacterium RIFCSPHIGHO2_02_FULL_54_17]OGZ14469.1 MAG: hypothetical protein A2948_02880 [Candidatus Lloydbacteria bacterium RIFCSPLOWO2_01_FULL_54_18]